MVVRDHPRYEGRGVWSAMLEIGMSLGNTQALYQSAKLLSRVVHSVIGRTYPVTTGDHKIVEARRDNERAARRSVAAVERALAVQLPRGDP